MAKITSILLIIAVLCTNCSKLFILSEYYFNTDEITKKYCENKLNIKLKCKGKCHLKKVLNAQDKQEEKSKKSIKELNETQLFSSNSQIQFHHSQTLVLDYSIQYIQNYNHQVYNTIFHPPIG
ncbi:MAG: hypothetical protein LCH32_05795 [Bacteroidetes bacterium]|nr:hypothetical protein [Bacteroidota bacterium]